MAATMTNVYDVERYCTYAFGGMDDQETNPVKIEAKFLLCFGSHDYKKDLYSATMRGVHNTVYLVYDIGWMASLMYGLKSQDFDFR